MPTVSIERTLGLQYGCPAKFLLAHLTWNGGDLNRLGELPVEEHVLLTARSAQCYIDSGYTMYVFGL
jgi:hypothetical protein